MPSLQVLLAHSSRQAEGPLSAALRFDGHAVSVARDGRDALERLADGLLAGSGPLVPDVVIAEERLPYRRATDLLTDLRRAGWMVPFVVLAAEGVMVGPADELGLGRVLIVPPPSTPEAIRGALAAFFLGPRSWHEGSRGPSVGAWPGAVGMAFSGVALCHETEQELSIGAPADSLDRRATPRAPTGLWVDTVAGDRERHHYCTSLGAGGFFLCGPRALPSGQHFTGRFVIPGQGVLLRVRGEVVRVCDAGPVIGSGARFTRLTEGDRRSISDFVSRRS